MDLAARRRPKGQTPTQDEEKTPLDRLESEIKERRRGGEQ
jgi:hypothetical protein